MTHFLSSTEEELLSEHLKVYHVVKAPEEAVAAALANNFPNLAPLRSRNFQISGRR
jgi:hypothetical protein